MNVAENWTSARSMIRKYASIPALIAAITQVPSEIGWPIAFALVVLCRYDLQRRRIVLMDKALDRGANVSDDTLKIEQSSRSVARTQDPVEKKVVEGNESGPQPAPPTKKARKKAT